MTHITIERAKLEQMLKALKSTSGLPHWPAIFATIADFEQALAAPTAQEPDTYGYAKRLAEAIWEKHYKFTAPQWVPFDNLIGVLTQIDNMTAGLITPPAAQTTPVLSAGPITPEMANWSEADKAELTAVMASHLITPPAAQRQWTGLTDEDKLHIEIMGGKSDVMLAEMVDKKLKERNT